MEELRMLIVDEVAQEARISSRGQFRQRAVKRKIKKWPIKRRGRRNRGKINIIQAILVIK